MHRRLRKGLAGDLTGRRYMDLLAAIAGQEDGLQRHGDARLALDGCRHGQSVVVFRRAEEVVRVVAPRSTQRNVKL